MFGYCVIADTASAHSNIYTQAKEPLMAFMKEFLPVRGLEAIKLGQSEIVVIVEVGIDGARRHS